MSVWWLMVFRTKMMMRTSWTTLYVLMMLKVKTNATKKQLTRWTTVAHQLWNALTPIEIRSITFAPLHFKVHLISKFITSLEQAWASADKLDCSRGCARRGRALLLLALGVRGAMCIYELGELCVCKLNEMWWQSSHDCHAKLIWCWFDKTRAIRSCKASKST